MAAYIYKKAGRWKQSIALSKKDNMYKDCMETASQSGDHDLAEQLLVYFIEQVYINVFQARYHEKPFIYSLAIRYAVKHKMKLRKKILLFIYYYRGRRNALPHVSLCVMT